MIPGLIDLLRLAASASHSDLPEGIIRSTNCAAPGKVSLHYTDVETGRFLATYLVFPSSGRIQNSTHPDTRMSGTVSGNLQGSMHQPMDDREHDILQFLKPLNIDDSTVHVLAYRFSKVYQELALSSEEQFLPTPVTGLPTGSETGRFLAIDVGGTNLRVAFIELLGETSDVNATTWQDKTTDTIRNAQRPRVRRTLEKAWPIGEHLKIDKTEDLFAWIGDCIAEVVGDYLANDTSGMSSPDQLDLGITFSFPMM